MLITAEPSRNELECTKPNYISVLDSIPEPQNIILIFRIQMADVHNISMKKKKKDK